jgi:chromosome segregation ATPase
MRRNVVAINQFRAEEVGQAAEAAYQDLREDLASALDLRNYHIREIQEAEAALAHITARVQKRKATLAKYEASILELRTKAHLLGVDRDLGRILMGI